MTTNQRYADVDIAKGFAIFLVVLGHLVAVDMPLYNEWYAILKIVLYKFHMPFFMFISGLIMAYTFRGVDSLNDYMVYVWKKFNRLSPGFIVFGIIIYIGKIFASQFMHVDDVPSDVLSEIYKLIVVPKESAGGSLWFIYVLMEMYIIFPIVITVLGKGSKIMLLIGLMLHFVQITNYFLIDFVFEYFLFFALGVYALWNFEHYLRLIDKYIILFVCAFVLSFSSIPYVTPVESKLVIGVLSIPALHGLARTTLFSQTKIWKYYGKYTYSIYLMNTIMIGVTKGVILKFTSWDGNNFLWIAPILLVAGIYAPILIKKYVFINFPILDRITA